MYRSTFLILILSACFATAAAAQSPGSMALSPARFELEMKPGTETTVVVNIDFRLVEGSTQPARIIASLNDWTITEDGRIEYFSSNSQPNSASSWMIYSPGEAAVAPGTVHPIRVTISVPENASPGDHLAALIVEQRPEAVKSKRDVREMIVRYRMASVFYIKVPGLTREGSFEDLLAESTPTGMIVTPVLRNKGNSMVRPEASLKVLDSKGNLVADMPDLEPLPILAGSLTRRPIVIAKNFELGQYTVKYRIDFHDGSTPTEGVTDIVVRSERPQVALAAQPSPGP